METSVRAFVQISESTKKTQYRRQQEEESKGEIQRAANRSNAKRPQKGGLLGAWLMAMWLMKIGDGVGNVVGDCVGDVVGEGADVSSLPTLFWLNGVK